MLRPSIAESEKASSSYLMSVVAVIAGLPLPIINLLATAAFYWANRKSTYFVRWHCTQALLSQVSFVVMNSVGFWWSMDILFTETLLSNEYVAYILTVLFFNFIEFIATIYTAVQTRKGIHVEWWLYGNLTNLLCKPETSEFQFSTQNNNS
ncbi:MAG: hypothetical protein SFU91_14345 [Chloroherpetonaceae bacterium]|nr:hypothetical protein [Chloroherpetonaceae bacterium]